MKWALFRNHLVNSSICNIVWFYCDLIELNSILNKSWETIYEVVKVVSAIKVNRSRRRYGISNSVSVWYTSAFTFLLHHKYMRNQQKIAWNDKLSWSTYGGEMCSKTISMRKLCAPNGQIQNCMSLGNSLKSLIVAVMDLRSYLVKKIKNHLQLNARWLRSIKYSLTVIRRKLKCVLLSDEHLCFGVFYVKIVNDEVFSVSDFSSF